MYSVFVILHNHTLSIIPFPSLTKYNFYLSKNREFTDIDSNENINLLQNYRNFETLYLPKCLQVKKNRKYM